MVSAGKIVLITGKFNPIHKGHISHIREASKLGDCLIIVTHPDYILEKVRGNCWLSLEDRKAMLIAILNLYKINGCVIVSIDKDGTTTETLRKLHPDIFAKGGDRTPQNMVQSEVDVCKELSIEIVYGVGELLGSSSSIMKGICN